MGIMLMGKLYPIVSRTISYWIVHRRQFTATSLEAGWDDKKNIYYHYYPIWLIFFNGVETHLLSNFTSFLGVLLFSDFAGSPMNQGRFLRRLVQWEVSLLQGLPQNISQMKLIQELGQTTCFQSITRWWFQIFFIFTPTWGRFPIWLIFFKWVETTNQIIVICPGV